MPLTSFIVTAFVLWALFIWRKSGFNLPGEASSQKGRSAALRDRTAPAPPMGSPTLRGSSDAFTAAYRDPEAELSRHLGGIL